jgi:hypothetical protein
MGSLIREDTDSIFLPFIHDYGTKGVPLVRATINGTDLELPVDTGSTGLLVGAPLLPGIGPNEGIPVHHYFTSSNILYKARQVNLSVTFHGIRGSVATSVVPVMVVDESYVCPWYDPNVDTFDCPPNPHQPKPKPRDTSRITYMGVGFGRNVLGHGMPSAVPRANPFLNVKSINGRAVSSDYFRPGYRISTEGVCLGLTADNTRDFIFTELRPGVIHHEDPRDWAMVDVRFSVDGEGHHHGSALIDTGIPHMYLRTDIGAQLPNITIRNPKKDGHAKWVKRVKPGTRIALEFPSLRGTHVANYTFSVGETTPSAPSHVVPEKQRPPPFVNTGRNFLFAYSIAFDAVGGRFGFRPKDTTNTIRQTATDTQVKAII